jgi:phosphatidylglycerol phospholipase C
VADGSGPEIGRSPQAPPAGACADLPQILGLWHYKFLAPAQRYMPYARMTHLGGSPAIARKHFWEHCTGFSLFYSALKTIEGQSFLKECKDAGKLVICWTANEVREFKDCYKCASCGSLA